MEEVSDGGVVMWHSATNDLLTTLQKEGHLLPDHGKVEPQTWGDYPKGAKVSREPQFENPLLELSEILLKPQH